MKHIPTPNKNQSTGRYNFIPSSLPTMKDLLNGILKGCIAQLLTAMQRSDPPMGKERLRLISKFSHEHIVSKRASMDWGIGVLYKNIHEFMTVYL